MLTDCVLLSLTSQFADQSAQIGWGQYTMVLTSMLQERSQAAGAAAAAGGGIGLGGAAGVEGSVLLEPGASGTSEGLLEMLGPAGK